MLTRLTPISLLRLALFGEVILWGLLAFPAAFAGADGGGWRGLIMAATPLLLVTVHIVLGIHLNGNARLVPAATAVLLFSTALLGLIGYEIYSTRSKTSPPPLAQGYDLRAHDVRYRASDPTQSVRWTAVLQKRFPIGSPVADLQKTLDAQGFGEHFLGRHGLDHPGVPAKWHDIARGYSWFVGPCMYSLTARWQASANGKIIAIDGLSEVTHGDKEHCP